MRKREQFTSQFELLERNDDKWQYGGYATTWGDKLWALGRPSGGLFVRKGAFKRTLDTKWGKRPVPIVGMDHDKTVIIGGASLHEDSTGLCFSAELNPEVRAAQDVYSNLKRGFLTENSIDFATIQEAFDNKVNSRTILEAELFHIAPVASGADPDALTTEVFSADDGEDFGATSFSNLPTASIETAWDGAGARGRVASWAGGPDNIDWKKFSKAFFWFDSAEADKLGAYKLPFADIIDGSLKAIWNGVKAAAGALGGARSPLKIPAGDKGKVRSHIARYYTKFEKETPFSASVIMPITIDWKDIRITEAIPGSHLITDDIEWNSTTLPADSLSGTPQGNPSTNIVGNPALLAHLLADANAGMTRLLLKLKEL